MTGQYKPYRLINNQEIKNLEEQMTLKLQDWNNQYALFALDCSLQSNPKPVQWNHNCLIFTNNNHNLALIEHYDLSAMTYCLFGDISDCFHTISKRMLNELLSHILDCSVGEGLHNNTLTFKSADWFYKGSTALSLKLSTSTYSMTLYLHPQWVFNQITRPALSIKPKAPIDEALDYQMLQCHVNLLPITLKLDDLMQLKVGDVIKTEHQLTAPASLKHNQQTICPVELGKMDHFKSIQLASSI